MYKMFYSEYSSIKWCTRCVFFFWGGALTLGLVDTCHECLLFPAPHWSAVTLQQAELGLSVVAFCNWLCGV